MHVFNIVSWSVIILLIIGSQVAIFFQKNYFMLHKEVLLSFKYVYRKLCLKFYQYCLNPWPMYNRYIDYRVYYLLKIQYILNREGEK